MKDHQRYFPMRDGEGKLMNLFLTVRNGNDYHLETVQHGNERVLRARLDDAKFFFEEDKKHKLVDYTEKLKKIVFQDGLGTLHDKAQRLAQITVFLNQKLDLASTMPNSNGLLNWPKPTLPPRWSWNYGTPGRHG